MKAIPKPRPRIPASILGADSITKEYESVSTERADRIFEQGRSDPTSQPPKPTSPPFSIMSPGPLPTTLSSVQEPVATAAEAAHSPESGGTDRSSTTLSDLETPHPISTRLRPRSSVPDTREPVVEQGLGGTGYESSSSGSDFAASRALKQKQRESRARGRDGNDTEDDDLEEDRELEGEVVSDADVVEKGVRKRKKRTKKAVKGKAKASAIGDDDPDDESQLPLKSGPLSDEAKQLLIDEGMAFDALVAKYATKYRKSNSEIRYWMGQSLQGSVRSGNRFNQFSRHWSLTKGILPENGTYYCAPQRQVIL